MKIQVYLKFEYLNSPLFLFIILCPTLKSYEYFLYFISIYQALILNKILSIHVLVVPVASPQCEALVVARTHECRFDALDALFLMCTTVFLTIIFFKYVTVF
jgi:hypothetical protein